MRSFILRVSIWAMMFLQFIYILILSPFIILISLIDVFNTIEIKLKLKLIKEEYSILKTKEKRKW